MTTQQLPAVCALALVSTALAAPVAFDNSAGVFVWTESRNTGSHPGHSFDATLPASVQPTGPLGQHSAQMFVAPQSGNTTPGSLRISCFPLSAVLIATVPGPPAYALYLPTVPESIPLGGVVDGLRSFVEPCLMAHLQDLSHSTPPTLYMLTGGGIVGARIQLADGVHYGWARLAYNAAPGFDISRWQPVEWGYETEPNTPIRANTYACTAAGDYTADGVTSFADLNAVLSGFGGQYSFAELNTVLSNFGQACR